MNVSIGRVELSRVPVTVWLFVVLMSYAPLLTHAAFPWFDYSDKYYTVQVTESLIDNQIKSLMNTDSQILQIIGGAIYVAAKAFELIVMLVEGVLTGFMPTWRLLGLDVDINGFNPAAALSGVSLLFLGWTFWKAYHGGLRA